jgi:glycosyltransferase involved in cell wall biosynthesis
MSNDNNGCKGNVGMLLHGFYPWDPRVRREAEALADAGYRVHVICLRRPAGTGRDPEADWEELNGVIIHRLSLTRKRGNMARYALEYLLLLVIGAWSLLRLHLKSPFHIVHVHNMPDFLVLAGYLTKLMGAKLVLDVHDPMPELYLSNHNANPHGWVVRVLKWQQRFSLRLADKLISVSSTMRENLEQRGIPSRKIHVCHNFPDTRYLPIKTDIARWPRHAEGLTLVYAGTVADQYHLDLAIEALAYVANRVPGLKLKIVGDGNRLGHVLALARQLKVEHCVEHIRPVQIDKLKSILETADIGISTQRGGAFGDLQLPCKILDYLSQGLPVISSRRRLLSTCLKTCSFTLKRTTPKKWVTELFRYGISRS